jgi:hypothetical protein
MSGLREYLKSRGAKPVDPAVMAEYDRQMREETIPAIERDMKAQARANHFYRLGIPDPLASADRSPEGQDAQRLDAKHESAVGSEASETPNTSPNTPKETSHD